MTDLIRKDLREEAVELLLPQFSNSANLQNFIRSLVGEFTVPYEDMFDIRENFDLLVAVGDQLDLIGSLLNTSRAGLTDDQYRSTLFAVIFVNSSTGSPENLIQNLNSIVGEKGYLLLENFPAEVQVRLYKPQNILTQDILDAMLPLGVGSIFFENPYIDKMVWELSEVDIGGVITNPNPLSVLPDVANIETSSVVLADVIFT